MFFLDYTTIIFFDSIQAYILVISLIVKKKILHLEISNYIILTFELEFTGNRISRYNHKFIDGGCFLESQGCNLNYRYY